MPGPGWEGARAPGRAATSGWYWIRPDRFTGNGKEAPALPGAP